MPTYLVTGAAGFIASRVAEMLAQSGATVVGVDNLNNYYDIRLKQHRRERLSRYDNIQFHELDIEDRSAVHEVFKAHQFDAVFNLAARAGVRYSLEYPMIYHSTNAGGNLNLLEEARYAGVRKYILASTSSLYAGQEGPFVESLPVNEPISPYAASKKAAEAMAYAYHHLFEIDVSIVRFFTVYGPAGRPDMSYFRFISWIDNGIPITVFGDGTQARDFTFVDDIARGTIAAAKPVGYEVINLGGGNQPYPLMVLIEKIENLLGKKAEIDYQPFHSADMMTTWADISKAKQLLDWEPTTTLDQGLEKCVQWYRDNLPWSASLSLETGRVPTQDAS
ncbi:MAG: NAD-dependent epimerase/dehydratase family protein [Planctomycetota bacterium]